MTMLTEDISSTGRLPESELYDRMRCNKLTIPSQVQQSVLFHHDALRPPSCDKNRRRDCLSWSVHGRDEGQQQQHKSRAKQIYAKPAGFVAAPRMWYWLHGLYLLEAVSD